MDGALGGVEQAGDLFGIAGIRREEPHGDRGAGLCLGFTALGAVSSRVSSSVFPSVSGGFSTRLPAPMGLSASKRLPFCGRGLVRV